MTAHQVQEFEPDSGRPAPARLAGWLPDGTPHHVPVGRLLIEGDRVCCHLCGRWFLSVASHLRVHGWTKDEYLAAFGLELGNSLAGPATHKRRAAAFAARQVSEPAIQRAQRAARERARTGALAAAAAAANRGRPHPPQRRPKTLAALATVRPAVQGSAAARRNQARLGEIASARATALGFPDFTAYAADRLAAGMSMAAISREAGLHKDWVSRHLGLVAPAAAAIRRADPAGRADQRWQPVLDRLGFADVAGYLRARHVEQHCTVAAIAAEAGLSRWSVESALERHGVVRVPHAGKRHRAVARGRDVVAHLGFASLADYIADRRARGLTWAALADEVGLPATTLRRHR